VIELTRGALSSSICLLGLLVAPSSVQPQAIQGTHEIVELTAGVYAARPLFGGARAAIVINDDGVLIVDSHSTPASASALIDEVRRMTDKPIRHVVNTHWHVDHHAGNPAYFEVFPDGVEFVSHHFTREDIPTLGMEQHREMLGFWNLEAAEERLVSGVDQHGNPLTEAQRAQIKAFIENQGAYLERAREPDFEFTTLPSMTFARSLILHETPHPIHILYFSKAHTRGDVVVYLPNDRILIAGDILTQPILWTWSSYPAEYIDTLEEIEKLDFDKIIVGHGDDYLEGKGYLRLVTEVLRTLVTYVNRGVADGLSLERIQAGAGVDSAIQAFRSQMVLPEEDELFDRFVGWTVERAYLEATGELE
jgi:cyclase